MKLYLREANRIANVESAKMIAYTRLAMNGESDDVSKVLRELQEG